MTNKTQQQQLDYLLRELNEGLEEMKDYYIIEEYEAKVKCLLYKLNEYYENAKFNHEPNP